MSVRRCMQEVDAREFLEWQWYLRLEPWGEDRADIRAGIIASTVANSQRGRGTRPYTPRDFMPQFRPQRPQAQTDDEIYTVFRHIAAATHHGSF